MTNRARPARLKAPRSGGRPSEAALEAADRLHSAALHLLRRLRNEDAASGLPAPRLSALSVVVFRGPITLGDLARAEQVRSPTMTRLVAGLERAGLVERLPNPTDARGVLVRATKDGSRVLAEGRRRRVTALARELVALPNEELGALMTAVDTLERIVGPRHWPLSGERARREAKN